MPGVHLGDQWDLAVSQTAMLRRLRRLPAEES